MALHKVCIDKSCNYKSTGNQNLNEHVKKTHPINFKCENCDEEFQDKSQLYSHMKNHPITVKSFENQSLQIKNEISCLRNELNSSLEKILGQFERNINRLEDKLAQNNDELKNLIKAIPKNQKENTIITQPPQECQLEIRKSYAQVTKTNVKQKENTEKKFKPKPHVLFVGDSLLHQCDFKSMSIATNTAIKTHKAYSSVRDEVSWFPKANISDVTKSALKDTVDHLIIGAPTVDISNLDTKNIQKSDKIDYLKDKVLESCSNVVKTAEAALEKYSNLKNVTIIPHSDRFDRKFDDPLSLKPNFAAVANDKLASLVQNSLFSDKLILGEHVTKLRKSDHREYLTDDLTGKYDGVHWYSRKGKAAYHKSVVNILQKSLNQKKSLKDHIETNEIISVTTVPTQNRFSILGN